MPTTLTRRIVEVPRYATYGRITRLVGLVAEASGMDVGLGELCRITSMNGEQSEIGRASCRERV